MTALHGNGFFFLLGLGEAHDIELFPDFRAENEQEADGDQPRNRVGHEEAEDRVELFGGRYKKNPEHAAGKADERCHRGADREAKPLQNARNRIHDAAKEIGGKHNTEDLKNRINDKIAARIIRADIEGRDLLAE